MGKHLIYKNNEKKAIKCDTTTISKTNIQGNQTRFHCDKRHSSNKLNLLEAIFEEEHLRDKCNEGLAKLQNASW